MEQTKFFFADFLKTAFNRGTYTTDDVIAFVLPLFEAVQQLHEQHMVAPFENPACLFVEQNYLDINEALAHTPTLNTTALNKLLEKNRSDQFEIVSRERLETDVDNGGYNIGSGALNFDGEDFEVPVYIRGYSCYEIVCGHHDALTDIFCLGLVLGSMAMGLNLYNEEEVGTLAANRRNPVRYNSRIHPTIAGLITDMTALDRADRSADLYDIIARLKNYRNYDTDKQVDLSETYGWTGKQPGNRNQFILNRLKNRLFDTTRRNRLLYYKPNARFVNLTVGSVPSVLHYQSIRPDLLFTWNEEIASRVKGMKELVLNKYLRFEDHTYLPAALNKIRVESQKDTQEYGFSQLRLVPVFLSWHNLKEATNERIQSPLLLVPVELKRNKRLTEDHFTLKVLDNAAEVNPILANQLKELYDIRLPEYVQLDETELIQFYETLKLQIEQANQGIRLCYVDKPKIRLIHSVARQTLSNYNRRLKTGNKRLEQYKNLVYSYQAGSFKPLGLEIFKNMIEPRSSLLEFLVNEDIGITKKQLTGDNEKNRALYQLADAEENPYQWEFDSCNMVLGNFNYKKMSLVRDYNFIADNDLQHAVFNSLFSNQPKPCVKPATTANNIKDWFHIITADPTQTQAIMESRDGKSYIIQGPPGTGKSQTITNLIADFVARGKSILFVCEKRAALDVVYHRLKQSGLDELCCYIHDSQSDKRLFIQDLKATYEEFSGNHLDHKKIKEERNALLAQLYNQLNVLETFHFSNTAITDESGIGIRHLMERILELGDANTVDERKADTLPWYSDWLSYGDTIVELTTALERVTGEEIFARHLFSNLSDHVLLQENTIMVLRTASENAKTRLGLLQPVLQEVVGAEDEFSSIAEVRSLFEAAVLLKPLAKTGNLKLAENTSVEGKRFDKELRQYRKQQKAYTKLLEENKHWQHKFSRQDLETAIPIAEKQERSFFRFLSSSWRHLRKQLRDAYNMSAHAVRPSYHTILQSLHLEYMTNDEVSDKKKELEDVYGFDDLETIITATEMARSRIGEKAVSFLSKQPDAEKQVMNLYAFSDDFIQLASALKQIFVRYENKSLGETMDELESLDMNYDALRELLPALKNFARLPDAVKSSLREIPLSAIQAEKVIAQKSLEYYLVNTPAFADINYPEIERAVSEIRSLYQRLLKLNALYIRSVVRRRFNRNLEISNTVLSQLDNEQKDFKKVYTEGRKILDNEFSKSMRYKSIRELSARESGLVLKDLKPVWMMSPLSVSDSLPLEDACFDVVIFDEASQITLEEGIPALFRSPQTIIVGDDKQMPPTNFFTARIEDADDLMTNGGEGEEWLSDDADSLLVQGTRKLNSSMLSWHYRSRYETLISFSNHAFYKAGLLTIPDRTIHGSAKTALLVDEPGKALENTDALYDRSISYHFLTNGIYERRNNQAEAAYIAQMVRELLKKKVNETIGIVAFSQEQQSTIEDALSTLADSDKEFEILLEEAWSRTEDGQFVGLIVKNLENIQGDERDIIIMSVCYGFDSRKKMIMNFGPINKKGGEKRLNVIFSRAKKHMAVISSIKHHHITNEYNEGANYFKRFLQYAESVSLGNMERARLILDSLVITDGETKDKATASVVALQLKETLEQLGYEVDTSVGQSDFTCSLAIRQKDESGEYALSILVDDDKHYNNPNLVEQYYQRPDILQAFGWRTVNVFVKDWLEQPKSVMAIILKRLTDEEGAKQSVEQNTIDIIPDFQRNIAVAYERLVLNDDKGGRFWEVAQQEQKLLIRFGKAGSRGQTQIRSFADKNKATAEKEKMIAEKLSSGYTSF